MFADASHRDRDGRNADDGLGVDLDRFYIDLRHRFDSRWSARVTTDVQWPRQQDPTDLWFKHAYLQGDFGDALTLRIGSAPLTWAPFANRWIGFRYVETELVSRQRFGSSVDWGIHAEGGLGPEGRAGYAVAAVTGAGFKRPRLGDGVDLEARVHWQPGEHSVLAIGSYRGTLAQDAGAAPRLHTARRWTAMAAYADERMRLGAQWFRAENWKQVTRVEPDAARGWSAWASWQLAPRVSLFARHDRTWPSLRLAPDARKRYSHLGVEWVPDPRLRLSLVGKRERSEGPAAPVESNEVGVWAQLRF